jgi:hypothetical protein
MMFHRGEEEWLILSDQEIHKQFLEFQKHRKDWSKSWASKLPMSFRSRCVVFNCGAKNEKQMQSKILNQEINVKVTKNCGKKTYKELQDYFLNT